MKRIILIALIFVILLSQVTIKPGQAKGAQVAFLVNGRLMVQGVAGGMIRQASPIQKSTWQSYPKEPNTISPDGKYQARVYSGSNRGTKASFSVMRRDNGTEVLSRYQIDSITHAARNWHFHLDFGGWLPDARHLIIVEHDSNSGAEWYTRCIVDVPMAHLENFNGWIAPNMKFAIVPNREGKFYDNIGDPVGTSPGVDSSLKLVIHAQFYAVKLSSPISSYKLYRVRKKRLLLNSKPFQLLPDATDVQFSSDGAWAICASFKDGTYGSELTPNRYLVSLVTDQVRKLTGGKARFV